MVNVAETALSHIKVNEHDITGKRMVKLNDRTIYNYESSNMNADNPNSCCEVIFQHTYSVNKDDWAVVRILVAFLEEPTFNTLRTQEQLGYIVRAGFDIQLGVLFITVLVQSSTKDADYLEHRINEFLANSKAQWDPTEAEVETIKAAVINRLKQPRTSLAAEASFNWNEIIHEEYEFASDLRKIEAIERVTKERLLAAMNLIFFENPRRLNMKVHSHAHRDDQATR